MAATQAVEEVASAAEKALDNLEKRPLTQQIAIGATSGLVTGYIFAKIGKSVAFCLGVSAIGMQFLLSRRQSGFNYKMVKEEIKDVLQKTPLASGEFVGVLRDNQVFFGSFGGGFLIGISFA